MNALDIGNFQAISMPGGGELFLILLIVLVVFGHNRIPQLGDALGKGIKNFRKSFAKDETPVQPADIEHQITEDPKEDVAERLEKAESQKVESQHVS